ncbi:MAG: response regulator transcription factor [Spirochaetales bacterium]|nr:response regulator transcription factor [Spirochaetales bacterium]
MAKLLICEDNDNLREAVVSYLKLDDHQVTELAEAKNLLATIKSKDLDLIILDVMLPDGDGFFLAKEIRKISLVPILFLTAKADESDRITGFELGGDDYVVKPFSPKELMLRVKAILRRSASENTEVKVTRNWKLQNHSIQLDMAAHRIISNKMEIRLTAAEWKILTYLIENHSRVISRAQLLTNSLEYLSDASDRTIDTHIKNIRLKLEYPDWIETVRGFGYRFKGEPL